MELKSKRGLHRARHKIIALIDMDCFYVQVHQRSDASLRGTPCAVVQYTGRRDGSIIAVSYEARALGVSRNLRAEPARAICPALRIARVPEGKGKADLNIYRDASAEVFRVLTTHPVAGQLSPYLQHEVRSLVNEIVGKVDEDTPSDGARVEESGFSDDSFTLDDVNFLPTDEPFDQSSCQAHEFPDDDLWSDPEEVLLRAEPTKTEDFCFDDEPIITTRDDEASPTPPVTNTDSQMHSSTSIPTQPLSFRLPSDFQVGDTIASRVVERASIDEAYLDLTDECYKRLEAWSAEQRQPTVTDLPNSHFLSHRYFSESRGEDEDKTAYRQRICVAWLSELRALSPGLLDELLSEPSLLSACELLGTCPLVDLLLTAAASIVEEIRARVLAETGFSCSAGIAHSKTLAKYVCGLNKPGAQSALPPSSLSDLWAVTKLNKVRNFGGKLGVELNTLGYTTMADLAAVSRDTLTAQLTGGVHLATKTAHWAHELSRTGRDGETVRARLLTKSIGCAKNFPASSAIVTRTVARQWVGRLGDELAERLNKDRQMHRRAARQLIVQLSLASGTDDYTVVSRNTLLEAGPGGVYSGDAIAERCYNLMLRYNNAADEAWCPAIQHIHLNASKFSEEGQIGRGGDIASMFATMTATAPVENASSFRSSLAAAKSLGNPATKISPAAKVKPKDKSRSDIAALISAMSPVDNTTKSSTAEKAKPKPTDIGAMVSAMPAAETVTARSWPTRTSSVTKQPAPKRKRNASNSSTHQDILTMISQMPKALELPPKQKLSVRTVSKSGADDIAKILSKPSEHRKVVTRSQTAKSKSDLHETIDLTDSPPRKQTLNDFFKSV